GAALAVGSGDNSVRVEGTQRSSRRSTTGRRRDGSCPGRCRLTFRRLTRRIRERNRIIADLRDASLAGHWENPPATESTIPAATEHAGREKIHSSPAGEISLLCRARAGY